MKNRENTARQDNGDVDIVRSLFLEKLLRDRNTESILTHPMVVECGLSIPSRWFYILRCDLIDSEDAAVPDTAAAVIPGTYLELLNEIQSISLEIMNNDCFTTYSCVVNGNIYFLVCVKERGELRKRSDHIDIQETLRELCATVVQAVWKRYEMKFQMWASDLMYGFEELRQEFLVLVDEDLSPLMAKPVMFPEDNAPYILSPVGSVAQRMQTLEQQVMTAAIDHEWQQCYEAFHKLMHMEKDMFPLRNHVHDRAIERLTQVFAVGGVPMNNGVNPNMCSHVWRKSLKSALSVDDVDAIVKEVLWICGELFQTPAAAVARVGEIVAYVDEHVLEFDLSAERVCNEFHISLSYFSRIFKEYAKVKFVDYIHERRVHASKSLLAENAPMLTVESIAERVGYSSALTYTRAFKRVEGMTPGSWRRLHREGKGEM